MTTMPEVNEGYYGEIIKKELRQHDLSYTDLEKMLRNRKIFGPKGEAINKSRIGNWAVDRVKTPTWFMVALGTVLYGDERWWQTLSDETQRTTRLAVSKHRIPLLVSLNLSDETIDISGLIAVGDVRAVRLFNDLNRPNFTSRDLFIIDSTATRATDDAVFLIEEPENSLHPGATPAERLSFRKATFDVAAGTLVLRSKNSRLKDIPATQAAIGGMLVQRFENWTLNTLARGEFDLSGQLFGEDW